VKLNDDGNTNQKLVDSTDSFRAQARSGAGGGKIGVAGSVAINIAQVHTRGMIGYGGSGAASVTLVGGDVDLEAQSRTDNFVDASPTSSAHGAGGSSVGVGASFGLNVVLRYLEGREHDGPLVARSTVMAVLVNGLTTVVGFGSLMVADHRGIFGLGLLLTLGMIATLTGSLIVLPVMLRWGGPARPHPARLGEPALEPTGAEADR